MTLDETTYKINGCAMKVHNYLGNGFQEVGIVKIVWTKIYKIEGS